MDNSDDAASLVHSNALLAAGNLLVVSVLGCYYPDDMPIDDTMQTDKYPDKK